MRQIAYPAALGSCVLGVSATPLWAAEWSITPNYSASVDYDSNRRLTIDGKGTGASVLTADVKFKRALEDIQFSIEPRYALRRFSDSSLGNGDDRTVNSEINWVRERSLLNLTASYWDQSTLATELLETGLVSGDTHRRLAQTGLSWNWNQTERWMLVSQLSYQDVSYYGRASAQLPGYRYQSGSLGEQFVLNERSSLTLSTYGSLLQSETPGNSSHELGLQAQIAYKFSERTKLDASLGESRRLLSGTGSNGTDASISLSHSFVLGKLTFSYTRSLVPYGVGFLVQQQQYNAGYSRSLTPFLDASVALLRIQNNETAVLLRIDRRNYNSVAAGLSWHPMETWNLGVRLEGVRTQSPVSPVSGSESVNAWRAFMTLTWYPHPTARSW